MNKNKPDHCFPTDPYRETHDKRTKTHSCDCDRKETHRDVISRQAAIDAIVSLDFVHGCEGELLRLGDVVDGLRKLPSIVVPIKDKCLTCIYCENCTDEQTFEEFMFGQDMGNPEDGSL